MEPRERRHKSIRRKISGTPERPRLSVYRSARHIYGQLVDDFEHRTLASSNSMKIDKGTKTEKSKECGKLLAKAANKKNIKNVVFDRGGCRYHGRIKAFAEGAREGGLQF